MLEGKRGIPKARKMGAGGGGGGSKIPTRVAAVARPVTPSAISSSSVAPLPYVGLVIFIVPGASVPPRAPVPPASPVIPPPVPVPVPVPVPAPRPPPVPVPAPRPSPPVPVPVVPVHRPLLLAGREGRRGRDGWSRCLALKLGLEVGLRIELRHFFRVFPAPPLFLGFWKPTSGRCLNRA